MHRWARWAGVVGLLTAVIAPAAGTSAQAEPTEPGKPTAVTWDGIGPNHTIRWQPPVSDGGVPVDGYRVRLGDATGKSDDLVRTTQALHMRFTGLPANTAFVVEITAHNSVGYGPEAYG